MLSVNSYFNDKVKSIAFEGEALPSTVGVISAGEYVFDTSTKIGNHLLLAIHLKYQPMLTSQ